MTEPVGVHNPFGPASFRVPHEWGQPRDEGETIFSAAAGMSLKDRHRRGGVD